MDSPSKKGFIIPITGAIKNYHWGKIGKDSQVLQLFANQQKWANCLSSFSSQSPPFDNEPCAELWLTTHPSGPASVIRHNSALQDYLKENLNLLGNTLQHFLTSNGNLPFIMKVLSVNKILSIQAHPDKALAEKLHKKDPTHYPDDNHKPELAIALTPFEGFNGFRPLKEVVVLIHHVPELQFAIGRENIDAFCSETESNSSNASLALKAMFTGMLADQEKLSEAAKKVTLRLSSADFSPSPIELIAKIEEVIQRVINFFPNDVGLISLFLLNYVQLNPSEAFFLAPNEPHAYLQGDCIEVMACSDNVVRAGCTPKFRDVPTLCSMLTYSMGNTAVTEGNETFSSSMSSDGIQLRVSHRSYTPPVPEYRVDIFKIETEKEGEETKERDPVVYFQVPEISCVSVWLVMDGEGLVDTLPSSLYDFGVSKKDQEHGMKIEKGASFLLGANTAFRMVGFLKSKGGTNLHLVRCSQAEWEEEQK